MAQTSLVVAALQRAHPGVEVDVVTIQTLGDRKQGTPEARVSDKKEWIVDLECALVDAKIDFAIHSAKDVPLDIEPGTVVHSALSRAASEDTFIGKLDSQTKQRIRFADLPSSAIVGTASVRRAALLKRRRPDLVIIEHRGNVPTRIQKLDQSSELAGIILAAAGLERLQLSNVLGDPLAASDYTPAINQGILAVQYLRSNSSISSLLSTLIERRTQACFAAERAVAEQLQGDCNSAIGIWARCEAEQLMLDAVVLAPDGSSEIRASERGDQSTASDLGTLVGQMLLRSGARALLDTRA